MLSFIIAKRAGFKVLTTFKRHQHAENITSDDEFPI